MSAAPLLLDCKNELNLISWTSQTSPLVHVTRDAQSAVLVLHFRCLFVTSESYVVTGTRTFDPVGAVMAQLKVREPDGWCDM